MFSVVSLEYIGRHQPGIDMLAGADEETQYSSKNYRVANHLDLNCFKCIVTVNVSEFSALREFFICIVLEAQSSCLSLRYFVQFRNF